MLQPEISELEDGPQRVLNGQTLNKRKRQNVSDTIMGRYNIRHLTVETIGKT